MDNHSQLGIRDILKRIEDAGVRPIPRQYFSLRNIGMWVLASFSVIVGSLAVSSIIFRVVNISQVLPPGMNNLELPLLVRLMPFLWIALLLLFSFLALREIRATKRGYRYELPVLLLSLLLSSCVLGIMFYASGTGFVLDRFAARHLPFHPDLEEVQRERWMSPKTGFLVGSIESVGTSSFMLRTSKDETWTILLASTTRPDDLDNDSRTGVRGHIINFASRIFLACDIRSLEFEGIRPSPPSIQGGRNHPAMRSSNCEDVRPSSY